MQSPQSKSQCRGCLAPETRVKRHVSIFENDLQQAYNDITQSQLLADSPYNNICTMCSKLLQSFSEFRLQCIESNAYFMELEAKEIGVVDEVQVKSNLTEIKIVEESIVDEEDKNFSKPMIEDTAQTVEEINLCHVKSEPNVQRSVIKKKIKKCQDEKEESTKEKCIEDTKAGIFICEFCPQKVFTSKQYYREHRKIHKEGKFECHFCGLKYRSKYFLLGHIDRNHLEKDFSKRGDFRCNLCPRRYLTEFRLKKHLGIHKLAKKPCPHCGELVKNMCSHLAKHNTTERFQCSQCEKSYKSRQHLEIHAVVHQNKLFSCDICGRSFNRPDKVTAHKKVHNPNRPTYECPECHKHFTFKTALTGHMRIHSGERPFPCLVCGMAFALSGNLAKHMHSHTGTKPYMCKFCNYGTKKKSELEFHVRMNHDFEEMAHDNQDTMLVEYVM